MKRWLLGILVVLGLALGCMGHTVKPFHYISVPGYSYSPLKVYKVWVDKNFGEADKVAIDDAIKQWNYAMNGYVVIQVESYTFDMEIDVLKRVSNGEGWVFLKIDSSSTLIDDGVKGPDGRPKFYTLAWVNEIGGNRMWMVRDRIANRAVVGVTLHEIGHLLGANHDTVYLMQPHYNWEDYRCVDYQALVRVAEYQHLPTGRLNYCVYEGPD